MATGTFSRHEVPTLFELFSEHFLKTATEARCPFLLPRIVKNASWAAVFETERNSRGRFGSLPGVGGTATGQFAGRWAADLPLISDIGCCSFPMPTKSPRRKVPSTFPARGTIDFASTHSALFGRPRRFESWWQFVDRAVGMYGHKPCHVAAAPTDRPVAPRAPQRTASPEMVV